MAVVASYTTDAIHATSRAIATTAFEIWGHELDPRSMAILPIGAPNAEGGAFRGSLRSRLL